MITYLSSFLGYKERSIGMFILVLFSCSLNAQTITGLSQIHLNSKTILIVKNQNVEAYQKKENDSIIEKGKIYVSKGTLVHNLDSESIQIIETKQKSTKKTNNYAALKSKSKNTYKASSIRKESLVKKINVKSVDSENLLSQQIERSSSIILLRQDDNHRNFSISETATSHENFLIEVLILHFTYQRPISFVLEYLSLLSVRPPPTCLV